MSDDLYLETIIEQAKKIGELEELVRIQGKFILKQSDRIEILEPQNELYREIIRSSIDEISSKLGLDSEAYEALGILEEGLEKQE